MHNHKIATYLTMKSINVEFQRNFLVHTHAYVNKYRYKYIEIYTHLRIKSGERTLSHKLQMPQYWCACSKACFSISVKRINFIYIHKYRKQSKCFTTAEYYFPFNLLPRKRSSNFFRNKVCTCLCSIHIIGISKVVPRKVE